MLESIKNYFNGVLDTVKNFFSTHLQEAENYITDHINEIQYGFRHYLLIFLAILFIYIINKYHFLSKKLVVILSWIVTIALFVSSIHNLDDTYALNNISIVELLGLGFVLFLAIMNTLDLLFKKDDTNKQVKIKIKKESTSQSNINLNENESILASVECDHSVYTFTNQRLSIQNEKDGNKLNIPYRNIVSWHVNEKTHNLQLSTSNNDYDIHFNSNNYLSSIDNAISRATAH